MNMQQLRNNILLLSEQEVGNVKFLFTMREEMRKY